MLSEAAIKELQQIKPKDWIPVCSCSECGNGPEAMNQYKRHKWEHLLDMAETEDEEKEAEARMQRTSRCCGAPFLLQYCSYFELLYQRWKKLDRSEEHMRTIRAAYIEAGRNYPDNFMLVQSQWGLGDRQVFAIVNTFEAEDRRELSSQPIVSANRKRGRPKGSKNKPKFL